MVRKGSDVVLVKLPERQIDRLRIGMKGKVLGVRKSIDSKGLTYQYLVKWKGKSGPVSHEKDEIREEQNILQRETSISGRDVGGVLK